MSTDGLTCGSLRRLSRLFSLRRKTRPGAGRSTIELARYARPGPGGVCRLEGDVWALIAALEAGVTSRARCRAEWLPRSLLVFRSRVPATSSSIGEDLAPVRVIDHAGL